MNNEDRHSFASEWKELQCYMAKDMDKARVKILGPIIQNLRPHLRPIKLKSAFKSPQVFVCTFQFDKFCP